MLSQTLKLSCKVVGNVHKYRATPLLYADLCDIFQWCHFKQAD